VTAKVVVIISATIEWRIVVSLFPQLKRHPTPVGEWFETDVGDQPIVFINGGWGKIAAAASAQYIIDRWDPELLVNLGTCGGFAGYIARDTVILAERTVVYDILEQMTDPEEAIAQFSTDIDLSWLAGPYPQPVQRSTLVSADRDLIAAELAGLHTRYGAVAGDWESGAIAWVAARNNKPCLILRGVTDLVGPDGGEAYDGNLHVFEQGSRRVLERLIHYLPGWLVCAGS
jgi:adenosylhomocysteine nucleosidase